MVPLPRGGYVSAGSLAAAVTLATAGPAYAGFVMCVGVAVGNGLIHRRPQFTTIFNSGVYILSPIAAGVVFWLLHPTKGRIVAPLFMGRADMTFLVSFLAAMAIYAATASLLVSVRVAWRRNLSILTVLRTNIAWELIIGLVFGSFSLIVVLIDRKALPPLVVVLCAPLLLAAYLVMLHSIREHAHRELEIVERIGRALMTLDPERLFHTMYTEIQQIMAIDSFFIALYDATTELLTFEFRIDSGHRSSRHTQPVSPIIREILTSRTTRRMILPEADGAKGDPFGWVTPNETRSAAVIFVPISSGNQAIGLLAVQSYSSIEYVERDEELLGAIATQAATAIANARLYDEARRARDELTVLYEVVKTISSQSLELQSVLDSLIQVTCRAFGYEYGAILLADEPSGDLEVRATYGYAPQVRGTRIPAGEGVEGWVQRTGSVINVPNVREDSRYIVFHDMIASELAVPLITKGKVIGVFTIESTRLQAFGQHDVNVLNALSGYAIIAIENARLFEQTKRLAITDGLTELFNHRYLHETLERTLERCLRETQPLALIMIEIDNFKWYNDTYGHRQGDEALRTVADLLRRGSRPNDLVARYGGDEFMIVLPNTTKEAAFEIAERIRRMVEAYPFLLAENLVTSVTLSLGVAATPEDGTSVGAIIEAVDRAQYSSKNSGGNKVHLSHLT